VVQQQFMSGLLASLPIQCHVCPELSKDFPENENASQNINGEIDFYVNGGLRWGIELVVNGDRITERLNRFVEPSGKYAKLHTRDYVIVDFRSTRDGLPTNITPNEKRFCIFFNLGSFDTCTCKFGLENQYYHLNLSP
jgi:hypothetical protein